MNILLTYYKCKDDWNDDRKLEKLVLEKILYHKSRFPEIFIGKNGIRSMIY